LFSEFSYDKTTKLIRAKIHVCVAKNIGRDTRARGLAQHTLSRTMNQCGYDPAESSLSSKNLQTVSRAKLMRELSGRGSRFGDRAPSRTPSVEERSVPLPKASNRVRRERGEVSGSGREWNSAQSSGGDL